jgi:DNA repair ATPase RecN
VMRFTPAAVRLLIALLLSANASSEHTSNDLPFLLSSLSACIGIRGGEGRHDALETDETKRLRELTQSLRAGKTRYLANVRNITALRGDLELAEERILQIKENAKDHERMIQGIAKWTDATKESLEDLRKEGRERKSQGSVPHELG